MNSQIKKSLEKGNVALLLGAGASVTSKDQFGNNLLTGGSLAKLLANEAGMEYGGEDLPIVYEAVKQNLGEKLYSLLEQHYKHCKPSEEYEIIASFPWARIYTLNIDDAFDRALFSKSPQKVNTRNRNDKISNQDQLFQSVDYIKLNGSIDRLDLGLIFSVKEYGKESAFIPHWYKELAEDYFRYNFIFIGTRLKEPLFYHQVERYRSDTNSIDQRSYLLTPNATSIEKHSLLSGHNIEHIPGTLEDFSLWLHENFTYPLSSNDLAFKNNPALGIMFSLNSKDEQETYAKIFEHVTKVDRSSLRSFLRPHSVGKIREFYKGFKPKWIDILDEIPAELEATKAFYSIVTEALNDDKHLSVLYGPAGSGKTTILMQIALEISDKENIPAYFINQPVDNLKSIITELEKMHKEKYILAFERIDLYSHAIEDIIENGFINNGVMVSTESQNIWESRTKSKLKKCYDSEYCLSLIDKTDAVNILGKLEKYGPWTRLSQFSPKKRISELLERAKRQLLIGLFEATSGIGFEKIIENEYTNISNDDERFFLILVGFATIHRINIQDVYIKRALTHLGIESSVLKLAEKMSGIIYYENNKLCARHSVYIRHLFDQLISEDILHKSLKSLLKSYTVYEAPIILRVGKVEGILFKSLVNHKFLKDIFRSKKDIIFDIYESFEKYFENDGLFWLQYGLALRDFHTHDQALEKLNTAFLAYQNPHTEHALAQQELIIASLSSSKEKAFALLERAKERLENLDYTMKSHDTYPIVSLSEGHTNILRIFGSEDEARALARAYANILEERFRKYHQPRLKQAWQKLSNFALNNVWTEEEIMFLY